MASPLSHPFSEPGRMPRLAVSEAASLHDDTLARLRAEYLEMPGLRLKADQVQRLCGIERDLCQAVLDELLETNFLRMRSDGRYARLTDGILPRPPPAKAGLKP